MADVTEIVQAADWAGREERSKSEQLHLSLAFQMRGRGLPPAETEHQFALESGRRWRFDFCWKRYMVACEIEGLVIKRMWDAPHPKAKAIMVAMGGHATPTGLQKDLEKYNHAALLGWSVIRVEQKGIKNGEACDIVYRMLHAAGWRPS